MRSTFLWLAFIGAVLAGSAAYLQVASMDLSHFGLLDYVVADSAIAAWWEVVGLPFLVGVLYLVAAVVCLRILTGRRAALVVIAGCLLLAVLLCLVSVGHGLFAVLALVALLVGVFPRTTSRQDVGDHGAA